MPDQNNIQDQGSDPIGQDAEGNPGNEQDCYNGPLNASRESVIKIKPEDITLPKQPHRFNGQPGPGRPKGVPNKVNKAFREYMEDAITHLQTAQTAKEKRADLVQWAEDNPDKFYLIASKLIPVQVQGEVNNTLTLDLAEKLPFEQLMALKYGPNWKAGHIDRAGEELEIIQRQPIAPQEEQRGTTST